MEALDVETEAERNAFEAGRAIGVAEALGAIEAMGAVVPSLLPPPGKAISLPQLVNALATFDPNRLAILRPYSAAEALTIKDAARLAGFAPRTLASWAERYRIGRHVGDNLRISRPHLLAMLDGDALALAALLSGRRDHPAVLPYLARCGIAEAA